MAGAGYGAADVAPQNGRRFLITGANAGIGYATAQLLAQRGAVVMMACRSAARGDDARQQILRAVPEARVEVIPLDLASLRSVQQAAQYVDQGPGVDVLINNAGVMMPPRTLTVDGFEMQFGVNHLGHFALTNRLLPMLQRNHGRIVTVSSAAHHFGTIQFADLHARRGYRPMARYAMSKLANLLFTFELQRKLAAGNSAAIAVACHPGGADTELARHLSPRLYKFIQPLAARLINSAAEGALPTLRAATHAGVSGGDFFGPSRFFQIAHSAVPVQASAKALCESLAARLWEVSVELTRTDFSRITDRHDLNRQGGKG